jgi:uncharacterized protein YndB with AHSA1/START domain
MKNRALLMFVVLLTVVVLGGLSTADAEKPPRTGGGIGAHMSETPPVLEKRDLIVTRLFEAPVERVWRAWTVPDEVMRWWGPTGFTSPSCKIDFREGGRFIFCMRAPKEMGGRDFYNSGVYKKIVPLKLIDFTQYLSDKEGNAIDPKSIGMHPDFPREIPSSLAFRQVGDKTELTATEYGWTTGQLSDMSEAGLKQCLDKLADLLARH